MTSPKRWLDDGAPPEVRRLLRAARAEAPSDRAVEKAVLAAGAAAATTAVTSSAVGFAGAAKAGSLGAAASAAQTGALVSANTASAVASAATAAAHAGASTLGWVAAKWGAGIIFGLGVATTTAATVRHYAMDRTAVSLPSSSSAERNTGRASTDRSVTNATPSDPVAPGRVSSASIESTSATAVGPLPPGVATFNVDQAASAAAKVAKILPDKSTTAAPAIAAADGASRANLAIADRTAHAASESVKVEEQTPRAVVVADPELLEEMRYLDTASAALRAGRPTEARRWVNAYRTDCKTRRMLPESMLLEMQIERALGDDAAAAEVARRIITTFPNSPHASRATQLLEALGSTQKE